MMTDSLIKVRRDNMSYARAYVGREYYSAFVVASMFVAASWFY